MRNKSMKNYLIIGLFLVLRLKNVCGDGENDIKRGVYPYMAVVYYSDETIVDSSGARFVRSAVLIRPDWLISSSLETNSTQLAFPQKTLLARVGAIAIDINFTLNEDEHEQEREIIQIVRPTNFNTNIWWHNDITLMKTLLPFSVTNAVGSTSLSVKHENMDMTCYILVYAKTLANSSEEKSLIQIPVELLPSSNENCGIYFRKDTMICASHSDETKSLVYDPDFCHGNGGGPLICNGDVIGLQTYVGSNCKQPFLYQLLSAWDDFISCGIDNKCHTSQCANICLSIEKDEMIMVRTNKIVTILTTETIREILSSQPSEDLNNEEHLISTETTKSNVIMVSENETPTPTILTTTESTTGSTTTEATPIAITESEEKATRNVAGSMWPIEKFTEHRKKLDEADDSEKMERKVDVEAQHHEMQKKGRNAARSDVINKVSIFIYSLSFGNLFLTCVV